MSVVLIADVSYQVSTPEEGSDEPKILGNKVLMLIAFKYTLRVKKRA